MIASIVFFHWLILLEFLAHLQALSSIALLILPILFLGRVKQSELQIIGEINFVVLNGNEGLLLMEFMQTIVDLKFIGCNSCLVIDIIFPFGWGFLIDFVNFFPHRLVVVIDILVIISLSQLFGFQAFCKSAAHRDRNDHTEIPARVSWSESVRYNHISIQVRN